MVEVVLFLPFLWSFLPSEQQSELEGMVAKLLKLQMGCLQRLPQQY